MYKHVDLQIQIGGSII